MKMISIRLFPVFYAIILLLSSCSEQKQNKLVLVVENSSNSDSLVNLVKVSKYLRPSELDHYIRYVGNDGVLYQFVPHGMSDTLIIETQEKDAIEVHFYYGQDFKDYLLLQTNDTVKIRFDETEQPSYVSLSNPHYNGLYLLQQELQAKSLFYDSDFMDALSRAHSFSYLHRKNPNTDLFKDYTEPAILEKQYYASVLELEQAIDSLSVNNVLPESYSHYYRYYLAKVKVFPFMIRQLMDKQFKLTDEQYAFFNDAYQDYVSYRDYIYRCRHAYAYNGTEWEPPKYYDTTHTMPNGKHPWYQDQRAMFDRLLDMQRSGFSRISDITYDIMLYSCLDNVVLTGMYSEKDAEEYLAKYKERTTNYLEEEKESASNIWGFPFKVLIFILQLNICIVIFYSLYRLLLYNTTSFTTCRIFLLMGIILSLVIALRLVSVNTFVPDIVLQQEQGIKFIGWAVVGIYALSAAYLLLMLIRQLVNVFIMWRNSWNIREGNYLLCILKDIVTSPSTFFRMVFISWGDFFDPESREERDMLLAHEEYHVRNLHSIDVLILTIMRFFCWFNPVFRKYAKELKQVNEYAADRSVVRGVGIRPYIRAFTDINTRQFEANEMLSYSSAVTGHRKRYDMIRRHGEDTSGSLLKLVCILPVFMLLLYLSPEFVVKYCSLPEVIINLF